MHYEGIVSGLDGQAKGLWYADKDEIYPLLGMAYVFKNRIVIRKDVVDNAELYRFLIAHELYHLNDESLLDGKLTVWTHLKAELRANWYGFKKCPSGFFDALLSSLNYDRLKFYYYLFVKRLTVEQALEKF